MEYNSNGILSNYKFSYVSQMVVEFKSDKYVEEVPGEYLYVVIGLIAISIVETIVYVYMRKRNLKKLNKIKRSC